MNYLCHYQTLHGLKPDGIVGKKTAAVMIDNFGIDKEFFPYFIAQLQHESANFTAGRENLNYSADALMKMFGKYFNKDSSLIREYARKPEKIANRIYANRMGNGNEESGDGWRFRGGGAIQLTGRDNYLAYYDYARLPNSTDPTIIEITYHYFNSAKFFFDTNDLWEICAGNKGNRTVRLSKAINLGNANAKAMPNGLEERVALTNKYFETLA